MRNIVLKSNGASVLLATAIILRAADLYSDLPAEVMTHSEICNLHAPARVYCFGTTQPAVRALLSAKHTVVCFNVEDTFVTTDILNHPNCRRVTRSDTELLPTCVWQYMFKEPLPWVVKLLQSVDKDDRESDASRAFTAIIADLECNASVRYADTLLDLDASALDKYVFAGQLVKYKSNKQLRTYARFTERTMQLGSLTFGIVQRGLYPDRTLVRVYAQHGLTKPNLAGTIVRTNRPTDDPDVNPAHHARFTITLKPQPNGDDLSVIHAACLAINPKTVIDPTSDQIILRVPPTHPLFNA